MSLITDALLIGSYAALMRGVLPTWRNGRAADVDFVCTRGAAGQMLALFGAEMIEHAPDRCYHRAAPGGRNIDVDLRGHLVPTFAQMADPMDVPLNGIIVRCLVARPELICAVRETSWDLVPCGIEKSRRDIAGYRSHGIVVDRDLAEAAKAFRKPA